MSSATSSESVQTPPASERDYVFNDETCRALRCGGRKGGRVAAVVGMFAGVEIGLFAVGGASLPLLAKVVLAVAVLVGGSKAILAVMKRVNLKPTRETYRRMKREIRQELAREADVIAGDPEAIEAQVLDDTTDSNARPELAFGLCPMACFIAFGLPLMVLYVALGEVSGATTILCVAGCIALSGVLFAFAKHEQPNTYPPEGHHDRH